MRFGAFVPQGWRIDLVDIDVADHWPTMLGVAKQAESLGFESVWVYDHFHTVPEPTQEVTYEAWTLMAALAVTTDTIRLGQMCTCNGYRPPPYLAKIASSIDVMSGDALRWESAAVGTNTSSMPMAIRSPSPPCALGARRGSPDHDQDVDRGGSVL